MSFQLRGADLAAMDKKLLGKNSSDPYYKLQVAPSSLVITPATRCG